MIGDPKELAPAGGGLEPEVTGGLDAGRGVAQLKTYETQIRYGFPILNPFEGLNRSALKKSAIFKADRNPAIGA